MVPSDTKPKPESRLSADTASDANPGCDTHPAAGSPCEDELEEMQRIQQRQRVVQCRQSLEELAASLRRERHPDRYTTVTREAVEKALDRLAELEETIIK